MVTTQEIVDAATELGAQVARHEAVVRLETTLKKLKDDVDAQRLFNDYHRHMADVGQKKEQGRPIEVQDKQRLESLQEKMVTNPVLRELQIHQMDYLDLMRRVDDAIAGQSSFAGLTGLGVDEGLKDSQGS